MFPASHVFQNAKSSQALVLFSIVVTTSLFGCQSRQPADGSFPLAIEEKDTELGRVWLQNGYHVDLPLRNKTNRDVKVVSVRSSCTCTVVGQSAFVVPAHGEAPLSLVLDLRGRPGDQMSHAHETESEFSSAISVRIDRDVGDVAVWSLHGTVRRPFSTEPVAAHFEDVVLGEPSPTRKVSIVGNVPLSNINVKVPADVAEARVVKMPDRSFQLELQPKLTKIGHFSFEAMLSAIRDNGEILPEVPLLCRGNVVDDFFALPQSVYLSSIGAAVPAETIVVQSRSGKSFSIKKVAVEPPIGFELSSASDSASSVNHAAYRVRKTDPNVNPSISNGPVAHLVFEAEYSSDSDAVKRVDVPIY